MADDDTPPAKSTLTVRLIRNFPYRNIKNLVLHDIEPTTTVGDLKKKVQQSIQTTSGFLPFRNNKFDTLKIYYKAHGNKPNNLVINLDQEDDHFYPKDQQTLTEAGIEHETELSYFHKEDYDAFKKNPETQW